MKAIELNSSAEGGSLQPLVSSDLRQLHKLVKEIVTYAEEPSMWPLTPQEQISFVRTVIFQARKIRNTEQYVTTDLMLAAEAFTANVRTQVRREP